MYLCQRLFTCRAALAFELIARSAHIIEEKQKSGFVHAAAPLATDFPNRWSGRGAQHLNSKSASIMTALA
jgi:hypothetical protein